MAKVAIVLPVYNVEEYLQQCLDSIINQTMVDIDIVVVNDGSTDNSLLICHKYEEKDKRIKLIDKVNGGLSSARNAGLEYLLSNSDFEYVIFVDSDDYVAVNMVEKLYNAAQKYNADLVLADHYDVYGKEIKKVNILPETVDSHLFNMNNPDDRYKFQQADIIRKTQTAWNKLFKRENFEELRFPIRRYEDTFMLFEFYKPCKKIVFLPDALYYYRKARVGSIMFNTDRTSEFNLELVDANLMFIEEYINYFGRNKITDKLLFKTYRRYYKYIIQRHFDYKCEINGLRRRFSKLNDLDISSIYKFEFYIMCKLSPSLYRKITNIVS